MRNFITWTFALAIAGAPLFAEDPKPADKPPEKPPAEQPAKPEKKEMSADAKKLYDDMKLVLTKYYDLVLQATKDDKVYEADQVWDTAVKESKNATYKDNKEFFEAVSKMQKGDRVFKAESVKLMNDMAEAHTKAVKDWLDQSNKPDEPKDGAADSGKDK